jgi:plasmid stabilization system protein ParE
MLLITAGVAGLFTWKSNQATPRIVRYCIIADIIVCALLCVNVGCHWIFSRQLSGAKQSTVERHAEEDREEKRKMAEVQRQLALRKAEADLAKADAERSASAARAISAEARRLAQLPRWMRRDSPMSAPTARPVTSEPTVIGTPVALTDIEVMKSRATEEQIRENWWWTLIALAFAECFASILAGGILMGVWEWDRNADGIPDHLQASIDQIRQAVMRPQMQTISERTFHVLRDGRREIVQSNDPAEVGQIWPAELDTVIEPRP